MAISSTVEILTNALWPQGDIRDPLGTWGYRQSITGDASGGSIKTVAQATAGQAAAYIFTIYSVLVGKTTQATPGNEQAKVRILTNWPNIDRLAGVQGYASSLMRTLSTDGDFTAPVLVPIDPFISSVDRFLLLFDPRPSAGPLVIIEHETSTNVLNDVSVFEGYGYFWDRSVLNAPGGPRHPGSS